VTSRKLRIVGSVGRWLIGFAISNETIGPATGCQIFLTSLFIRKVDLKLAQSLRKRWSWRRSTLPVGPCWSNRISRSWRAGAASGFEANELCGLTENLDVERGAESFGEAAEW